DEHVEFLERALVHEELHALARRELAALVLRLDARRSASGPGAGAPLLKLVENVLHGETSSQPSPTRRRLSAKQERGRSSIEPGSITERRSCAASRSCPRAARRCRRCARPC